jgi:nicotinamide riboside transporter PnuC
MAAHGLDWIAALLGIVAQTLIRRRRWHGYALSVVTQSMYLYLLVTHELTGLALLILFNLGNAVVGLYQWRALDRRART